jgi:predicted O-linked N-acetylglucosamine transferase (SPINDLY family)/Flp pilus assembly protein TadD
MRATEPLLPTKSLLAEALQRHRLGDVVSALPLYCRVLALDPADFDAAHMAGVAMAQQDIFDSAIGLLQRASKIAPTEWSVFESSSIAHSRAGRHAEALQAADQALVLACGLSRPYLRQAKTMQRVAVRGEALSSLRRAVVLDSASAEIRVERGNVYYGLGFIDEAIDDYTRVIVLWPERLHGYLNTGVALLDVRRFVEGLVFLGRAAAVDPTSESLSAMRLLSSMYICDWNDWPRQLDEVLTAAHAGLEIEPFALLSFVDDPALHLLAARTRVHARGLDIPRQAIIYQGDAENRIRIGYFSADFHDHATTFLMAELIESHDRSRFEVFGFSFGPPADDAMRTRMMAAFEHFIDVGQWSDEAIAAFSRQAGIDIAIDLKGYTRGSRPAVFAIGCAPIQVSYLGYPGTTALPAIDYVIADKTVIPGNSKEFFTEKVVYLPGCYQVNDSRRVLPVLAGTRASVGLGSAEFVFCCFNTPYKIHPDTFACWMRILKAVPKSALWLIEENSVASDNLRRAAEGQGVDPARLVFAPRAPNAVHLARLGHADLFIDTYPYTAHTTASDALWAGVPVLTQAGRSFASRVAASLLTTLGLNELITSSSQQFENKAIEFARSPERLMDVRRRLDRARKTSTLFDGRAFCGNLERAFEVMLRRYRMGMVPDVIDLSD